jgi:hypothetical protein
MVSIKCGNCHGTHESTQEVRTCYQTPAVVMITERQLSYLTDLVTHREMPEAWAGNINVDMLATVTKTEASTLIETLLKQPKKTGSNGLIPGDIPDGRYAFMDNGTPRFYRIVTKEYPTGNRRFINKVLGAPGDFRYVPISNAEAREFITAIKDDPAYACQLFGYVVGACGICGSPLTDPESIALGIGPVCAKKSNW